MSDRFLPTLKQLKVASEELPEADLWPDGEYLVPLKGNRKVYEISFEKVKFASRSKGKTYKWVYNGKVMIGSKRKDDEES